MCGIWACLGHCSSDLANAATIKLLPRGPEQMKVLAVSEYIHLGFTRLAINGLHEEGMQPMTFMDGESKITWVCNGEI